MTRHRDYGSVSRRRWVGREFLRRQSSVSSVERVPVACCTILIKSYCWAVDMCNFVLKDSIGIEGFLDIVND